MAMVRGLVLIHLMYFAALIESDPRAGDMGQVYPIARGSAPLMTAVATTTFIDERLGLLGWCGILLLVAGVLLLSLRGCAVVGGRSQGRLLLGRRDCAVTICAYSVVDGVGARLGGSANAYSATPLIGICSAIRWPKSPRRGRPAGGEKVLAAMGHHWGIGLAGGSLHAAALMGSRSGR